MQLCGNPRFARLGARGASSPQEECVPTGRQRERRHGWWKIWRLLRLDRPTWTTKVEEDWQLIRTQEWVGNRWNGGLVPAEKRLLALHRIKLPQSAGEPKRINSQRRMLGAFPGRQTCQGLLDTDKTSGSESSWIANCWSWGGVSRESTTPNLPFYSTLSFPSWVLLPETGYREIFNLALAVQPLPAPEDLPSPAGKESLYLLKLRVIQSWSLNCGVILRKLFISRLKLLLKIIPNANKECLLARLYLRGEWF